MPCILLVGRSIEIRRLERARAGKLPSPTEGDKALRIRIDMIHRPCIAPEFNGCLSFSSVTMKHYWVPPK
jgi:hypothetical protein